MAIEIKEGALSYEGLEEAQKKGRIIIQEWKDKKKFEKESRYHRTNIWMKKCIKVRLGAKYLYKRKKFIMRTSQEELCLQY